VVGKIYSAERKQHRHFGFIRRQFNLIIPHPDPTKPPVLRYLRLLRVRVARLAIALLLPQRSFPPAKFNGFSWIQKLANLVHRAHFSSSLFVPVHFFPNQGFDGQRAKNMKIGRAKVPWCLASPAPERHNYDAIEARTSESLHGVSIL
jgi:hypothetical protein